jgi:hypothetical protein
VPFGLEAALGLAYMVIGQPERTVEWCRTQLARGRDTHAFTRATLVIALTFAGCDEEARAAANGLIDTAEATHNPWALSLALWAYGTAFRHADPDRARDTLRRGLVIAQDSGNRARESYAAASLAQLEAEYGATRWPRSITSSSQSATCMTPATAPRSVPSWLPSPPFSTGSGTTKSPRP